MAIPMVLCATSLSCTTTATTLTVLLRDGETIWSGVEPLRTMTLTRNLVSALWLVRLRTIKGWWSIYKWLFELESKELSVIGQLLMTSNELHPSPKTFKAFLKFCFVLFSPLITSGRDLGSARRRQFLLLLCYKLVVGTLPSWCKLV